MPWDEFPAIHGGRWSPRRDRVTPRVHFRGVADELREIGKPVDFVCGLAPGGVEEAELYWRISQLSEVRLLPARLECNLTVALPRFSRLFAHTQACSAKNLLSVIPCREWDRRPFEGQGEDPPDESGRRGGRRGLLHAPRLRRIATLREYGDGMDGNGYRIFCQRDLGSLFHTGTQRYYGRFQ